VLIDEVLLEVGEPVVLDDVFVFLDEVLLVEEVLLVVGR
jgi:hypothetical protein